MLKTMLKIKIYSLFTKNLQVEINFLHQFSANSPSVSSFNQADLFKRSKPCVNSSWITEKQISQQGKIRHNKTAVPIPKPCRFFIIWKHRQKIGKNNRVEQFCPHFNLVIFFWKEKFRKWIALWFENIVHFFSPLLFVFYTYSITYFYRM